MSALPEPTLLEVLVDHDPNVMARVGMVFARQRVAVHSLVALPADAQRRQRLLVTADLDATARAAVLRQMRRAVVEVEMWSHDGRAAAVDLPGADGHGDHDGCLVSLAEVVHAAAVLRDVADVTPMLRCAALEEHAGGTVLLKCETLQRTGAFKLRGAYHRLARLSAAERDAGLITASSGNHAQGVALAARLLGLSATVVMPESTPAVKVEATRRYGAEVVVAGSAYDDAELLARTLAAERGLTFIHPFDDPAVVAGQGTIGLEILAACPDAGTVLVPVGGGGLIAGVAAAIRRLRPTCRIVGVQPVGAAAAVAARRAGRPVTLDDVHTVCDGVAVRRVGSLGHRHIAALVDDLVTVADDAVQSAVRLLQDRAKLVVEPAGALGAAALLSGAGGALPSPVVVVLSGGNA